MNVDIRTQTPPPTTTPIPITTPPPTEKTTKIMTSENLVDWPLRGITEPHENDFLYGKGGITDNHPGNKLYIKMVEERRLEYINSESLDKALIALEIIRSFRAQDPPGRFLKMDKSGLWKDVGDKKAREKTSRALRDMIKEKPSGSDEGKSANDSSVVNINQNSINDNVPKQDQSKTEQLHVEEIPVFIKSMAVKKAPRMMKPEEFHTIVKQNKPRPVSFSDDEQKQSSEFNYNGDINYTEWVPNLNFLKEKLYNQNRVKDEILDAYHRGIVRNHDITCTCPLCRSIRKRNIGSSKGRVDLLLISGPTGTGKTRLALSLKDHMSEILNKSNRVFFISCKYDQFSLQRRDPREAFATAFTEFTDQVWERGQEAVLNMRDSIRRAGIGKEEETVLVRMIPALVKIVGETSTTQSEEDVTSSSIGEKAGERFFSVLRMFVKAISSPEQPVILLVDDMHWADLGSLCMLKALTTDSQNIDGLVIVGTYDDDYVTLDSQFSTILREMEDEHNVNIQNIHLPNHNQDEIHKLLTEWLYFGDNNNNQQDCKILSDLVFHQTNGNNFYVLEFIRWLVEENLLRYNMALRMWEWDEQEISLSIDHARGLGDFLVDKLQQLPMNVQEVLKVAACLVYGTTIDLLLVSLVLDFPVEAELEYAVNRGILFHYCGTYTFSHAGFQWASYALISDIEKESFHLRVGRKIWNGIDEEDMDKHIFVLLSQLSLGSSLISSQREKDAIAMLCLHAGKRAAMSSMFCSASVQFNFALNLLNSESCWRDQYELSLALHDAAAEIELVNGNVERANSLLDEVFANVNNIHDQVQAYSSKIHALSISGKQKEAVDTGIDILKRLGEKFPKKFRPSCLEGEMKSIRRLLRNKSDEQLLRMPIMEDRGKLAIMQILNLMITSSLVLGSDVALFLELRWLKLTLKYGLSIYASYAFAIYAQACLRLGHTNDAFRFGKLAIELLDRFQLKALIPRVYTVIYALINIWNGPVRDTLEPLHSAYQAGLETGDNEFAFFSAWVHGEYTFFSGTPLHIIEPEMRGILAQMEAKNHDTSKIQPFIYTMRHYKGLPVLPDSSNPSTSSSSLVVDKAINDENNDFDIFGFLQHEIEIRTGMYRKDAQYWMIMLGYDFGNYELAAKMANVLDEESEKVLFPECMGETRGFAAVALTNLKLAQRESCKKHAKKAKRIAKMFERLCKISPHNCLNKHYLLQAEIASTSLHLTLKGKNIKNKKHSRLAENAYNNYVCAISLAKSEGFLYEQALANELLAHHLFRLREPSKAKQFFEEASHLYLEWGAKPKVEHLRNEMLPLLKSRTKKDV